MKKFLPLFFALALSLAVTITVPPNIPISGSADIGVHVADGTVGKVLLAEWSNEKIHVFPGQYVLESPSQQFGFKVFIDQGACGYTEIKFFTNGGTAKTAINLPNCSMETTPLPPVELPVESEFRSFETRRLGTAEKYLQINRDLRNMISEFHSLIEEAKSTSDFTEKTKYTDQASAILNDLKIAIPYIVEKSAGTAVSGTNNMKSEVSSRFGEVTQSPVLFYKKYSRAEAQSGGTTANPTVQDFTLFSINLYNPLSENTNVYLIEDKQADNWSEDPAYVGGVTIWEITLTPGERRTISYEVNELVDTPITTQVYEAVPAAEPGSEVVGEPQTEVEPVEEEPKDLVGQIMAFFTNIENFFKGLF
jgi:hypothetical protein